MKTKKIAIVGAGITGLTSAWSLQKKGFEVVVFERKEQPGGAVKSVSGDGWLVEYGPNTLQLKNRRLLEFLKKLGLDDQLVEANRVASSRYIIHDGELKEVPASLADLLKTDIFSAAGKARVLKEPFVRKGVNPDETVADFVERRLGREILDYAVNPFVAGIYAASPDELSVRHAFPRLYNLEQNYGSLVQGAFWKYLERRKDEKFRTRLVSFQGGLQTLPEKIASSIHDVRYESDVSRVHRDKKGWVIIANGATSSYYDHVILNLPLYRFSEQLINGGGTLLAAMAYAGYPPLSVVQTGFRREQVEHPLDGFGFLVPEAEDRRILGSLFNSTLFPHRAPDGSVLITTFVGGARQPELAAAGSEELKELVGDELNDLLGVRGDPRFFDHIYWPRSIPHYTPEYGEISRAVNHVETLNPGVRLAGNYKGGISLPDCIESGFELADSLMG